jgi:hypothetical protein
MKAVAAKYPSDDTIKVLYAEALMDTQPMGLLEAAGAKPKGHGAEIIATLEEVLKRNPRHPGAAHLYIHAMEASTNAREGAAVRRSPGRSRAGAGHLVHMPAHIYYPRRDVPQVARDQQGRDEGGRGVLQDVPVGSALQVRVLPAQHPTS